MNPRIYAILLTILMTLPVFSKVVVYFNWKINQDYISKNLCVNKNKPVLKCKGKCQLMMKMKETEPVKETPLRTYLKDVLLSPFVLSNHQMYYALDDSNMIYTTVLLHHFNKFHSLLSDKRLDNPPDTIS